MYYCKFKDTIWRLDTVSYYKFMVISKLANKYTNEFYTT